LGLYFLLFSVVAGLPWGIVKEVCHINNKLLNALATTLSYIVAAIWTIWLGLKKSREMNGVSLKLKFNKVPVVAVLISILMIMTMPVLTDPVSIVIPMPDSWKKIFEEMFDLNVFSIFAVVIAAPILEESLFRGVILNGLLKKYSPQTAIAVSAAIFAAVHLNPWQAIPAFLGGLIMGWMYWKTNSLIPGMILHFVNNAFSTALGLAFPKIDTLKEAMSTPMYVGLFVSCAIVLFGGWIFLERYFEDHPAPEDEEEFEPELVTEE